MPQNFIEAVDIFPDSFTCFLQFLLFSFNLHIIQNATILGFEQHGVFPKEFSLFKRQHEVSRIGRWNVHRDNSLKLVEEYAERLFYRILKLPNGVPNILIDLLNDLNHMIVIAFTTDSVHNVEINNIAVHLKLSFVDRYCDVLQGDTIPMRDVAHVRQLDHAAIHRF